MITWISFAKTMADISRADIPFATEPLFAEHAARTAEFMSSLPVQTLMDMLGTSRRIAEEASGRYRLLARDEAELIPALEAYSGAVFKHINAVSFDHDDWTFAQDHIRIMSSLYGILRPLDRIGAYRLESGISIDGHNTVAQNWKPLLTDGFISLVMENGGVLADLASEEMKTFLDWKQVSSSLRIVTPDFYERRNGRLKAVTMYAKMCRGEMVGYIVRNRVDSPDDLRNFSWEGFEYDAAESSGDRLVFVRNAEK